MYRRPERRHPAAWAGPERGYRPPTAYPGFEGAKFRCRYSDMPPTDSWPRHRVVDAPRYRYSEDLKRQINEQNVNIARRPRWAQGRYFEPERSVPKRVRFSLPTLQREKDEVDNLARKFATLSIGEPYAGPGRRRCSRCGQKLSGVDRS